ncbi:MAG: hypothetical protein WBD74_05455 [Candidatus Aquilonibacter sp.]
MRAMAMAMAAAILIFPCVPAGATGTVRIQKPDGTIKTYTNVLIRANSNNLALTSSDGKGTLVFGRASCTKVGELLQCLAYDATLLQNGERMHVALKYGTVWYNPSKTTQTLSHSSIQLPYHGILMSAESKKGIYVSLTGVVDELLK